MPKTTSAAEMRKMSPDDLRKEIAERRASVAKMKLGINMRSHKDTAQFRRDKKEVARLLTVLGEVERGSEKKDNSTLKDKRKVSTVPASAKKATGKSATSSK